MSTDKASPVAAEPSIECCMCGDHGLSCELFNCKVCQFRSQHRYCSNQFPKAESYRVCNWCLNQRDDATEKTQNSSDSSSSYKNNGEDDRVMEKKKKYGASHNHGHRGLKGTSDEKGTLLQQVSSPIKKQRSQEGSPSPSSVSRKRIATGGGTEEMRRRTKSEEISNGSAGGGGGITKQVFRNKVRRYKLLDEVSSH